MHQTYILHQIALNFDIFEIKASLTPDGPTNTACREATMADKTGGALAPPLFCHIDGLLAQLMVALNATDGQRIEVDIAEFAPATNLLALGAFVYILCVPSVANLLIGRYVIHHLMMHR